MKVNRHLIMAAVTGVGLIASVVMAFRAGMKANEILEEVDPDGEMGKLQRLKKVLPVVGPSAVALGLTGAGIAAEALGVQTEFRTLKHTVTDLTRKKERLKREFTGYRDAVKVYGGKERDVELALEAAEVPQVPIDEDGETSHVFELDWFGDERSPIYIERSWKQISDGIDTVNRLLVDETYDNRDYATVSDFLQGVGLPTLCDKDTDEAGWSGPVLRKECNVFWLDWTNDRVVNKETGAEVIRLTPTEYPNFNVEQYAAEAEARGYTY